MGRPGVWVVLSLYIGGVGRSDGEYVLMDGGRCSSSDCGLWDCVCGRRRWCRGGSPQNKNEAFWIYEDLSSKNQKQLMAAMKPFIVSRRQSCCFRSSPPRLFYIWIRSFFSLPSRFVGQSALIRRPYIFENLRIIMSYISLQFDLPRAPTPNICSTFGALASNPNICLTFHNIIVSTQRT